MLSFCSLFILVYGIFLFCFITCFFSSHFCCFLFLAFLVLYLSVYLCVSFFLSCFNFICFARLLVGRGGGRFLSTVCFLIVLASFLSLFLYTLELYN